jgi:hypothetical protein
MRTGRGGIYLLAVMFFTAGLMMAAGPVRAQNQPSKLYLTPGAESTAHPLFLQRLFGSAGTNSGLGQGKPYDFSTQRSIRQETQDWREMADRFNAENKAKFDAVIDERKKAIADMYAESDARLRQDELMRRQVQAQIQAQMQAQSEELTRRARAKVVYVGVQRHPPRDTGRSGPPPAGNTYSPGPPVFYNGRQLQQNAHPPIFLH